MTLRSGVNNNKKVLIKSIVFMLTAIEAHEPLFLFAIMELEISIWHFYVVFKILHVLSNSPSKNGQSNKILVFPMSLG